MPILKFEVSPPEPGRELVEAWTVGDRLPYRSASEVPEATGMRRQLRTALKQLTADDHQLLHATLISPWVKGADAENVLFYNAAAPTAFGRSCRRGLRFEHLPRTPVDPRLPRADHEQRYELADLDGGFRHWRTEEPLISFDWAEVPNYNDEDPKTSEVWWPIQNAGGPAPATPSAFPGRFALTLELETTAINASTRIKKAIDGAITAHQFEPGSIGRRVLQTLQAQLTIPAADIEAQLRSRKRAILGPKPQLIEPWGRSLRFSPDDDRLMAFELILRPTTGPKWRMRGSFHAIQPAEPPRRAGWSG